MFSPTEERLRTFVEKLSTALTDEVEVIVQPGDNWAAYPREKPPRLIFRLTDVAVIGDNILAVTAHEIAHLLYTTPHDFPFDVSKKPRAAHLLLNVVEDARIERVFSEQFPGGQSLFDSLRDGIYDFKVQRGFDDLPIKWRFFLNIDRVLHGLEPWGDDRDVTAVELALDDCIDAMMADTTQEAADRLEKPYKILLDLMRLEAIEQAANPPQQQQDLVKMLVPPELLGLPPDYDTNSPLDDEDELDDRTGDQTDHAFDQGADEDDHKVGGEDGTDGKRDKADGGGTGEGKEGSGQGESGEGVGEGEGAGKDGGAGGSGAGGWGDNDPLDGTDDETAPDAADKVKPTNIIDEMVNEEAGRKNKAIDILSYRQRQRAKEAKEVERKIAREEREFLDDLGRVFGRNPNPQFRERMRKNAERYRRDVGLLSVPIQTLRNHARNILRDNAMERFGGNHTSGRKVKTNRLCRVYTDDLRYFERREFIGGRSYDIALVVDQSTSMNGMNKQTLAYQAALIFLEAFDGLAGTSVIGFSEMDMEQVAPYSPGAFRRWTSSRGNYQQVWQRHVAFRTYKGLDSMLRLRHAAIPELDRSFNSTPMEAGVAAATEQLRHSQKEVRAMIVISDGMPNDAETAIKEFMRAKRLGIVTYGLHIGGRTHGSMRHSGFDFLVRACDKAVAVHSPNDVPNAVNRLLRGIIRSRRVAS